MLQLKNLSKSFYQAAGEKKVLNKISLQVKKGQVFGFLGLNGQGKTTTVKLIGGLLFPDEGSITIDGFDHTHPEARQRLGFMNENPQFHLHLNAREVLEYVSELFEINKEIRDKRIKTLLKEVGLEESSEVSCRKFSKGMLQRLAFAAALINEPQLLILDEPLDGLDPLGRLDFKRLINNLRKQGKTIFFSTHILSDVEEICDEVAILHNGKIIAQGSPQKLTSSGKKNLEEVFVEMVRNKK